MADLIHGNTQMGATKMDIITALVQRELKFAAKLAKYFTDVSRFATKGAKSISFPKLGSFTVTERPSGVAGDASVIASTVDQLLLNVPAYIAYIVDSNDSIQSVLEWESECAKRAGASHARYLDTKLITELLSAAGFVAAGAGDITKTNILDMRQFMVENEANLDETVLIIPPDQEKVMLGIDEFTRADIYGSSNVPAGVIGRVYGVNVLVHNSPTLVAQQAVMATKDSLAYGFQLGPKASEQGANEFGSGAKRVAVDQLFGVKAMQIDQSSKTAPIAGKSGLIAKLN